MPAVVKQFFRQFAVFSRHRPKKTTLSCTRNAAAVTRLYLDAACQRRTYGRGGARRHSLPSLPLRGPGNRTQARRARIGARRTPRNASPSLREARANHSDSRTERPRESTLVPGAHLDASPFCKKKAHKKQQQRRTVCDFCRKRIMSDGRYSSREDNDCGRGKKHRHFSLTRVSCHVARG